MGHYRHLTIGEREYAMVLLAKGLSLRAIARKLKRAASTISREFARNYRYDGTYGASYADKLYRKRRKRCGPKLIFADPKASEYVKERILLKWTPEQIAGRAKLEGFPIAFSYATIYRAIDKNVLPYSLKKELRFKSKYKKHQPVERRGRIQDITSIHDRPACIKKRLRIGHWEGDTVHGQRNTGVIGTHVERKTGYLIAFKMDAYTSEGFTDATIQSFSSLPLKRRKTLTVDNGREFTLHKKLAAALGMKVYFCDPHAPWQRGTNENTNGLLRQFFPKKTSFSLISPKAVEIVVGLLNNRPRKRLGWKTPAEVFFSKSPRRCCT